MKTRNRNETTESEKLFIYLGAKLPESTYCVELCSNSPYTKYL